MEGKNPITPKDIADAYKEALEAILVKIEDPSHQEKIRKRTYALIAGMGMLGFNPSRTSGEAIRVIGSALESLIPLLTAAQDPGDGGEKKDPGKTTIH